jgi:succinate dehydrogenase / fumarate reductase membrane anchor subunit
MMIENPLRFSRTGLRDWLIQRITAVILGLYFIFLFIYFAAHSQLNFTQWQGLFAHPVMRFFTFFALLSTVWHTWIGMWTVLTDYVKCKVGRLLLEVLVVMSLIVYLIWGVAILWRI